MNRKRIAAVLGCAAAGFLLAGCESGGAERVRNIKIGVAVYDQYDTFISQLVEQFNQCAAEMSDSADSNISVKIEVYNAGKSQTTQNDQVKAEKQDVPVIFFNRELVEQDLERWDRLYYVGAPALQSGILQGEMAADLFQKDPSVDKNEDGVFQYVVLEGEMDHQDAIVRTEYAINTITEQCVSV